MSLSEIKKLVQNLNSHEIDELEQYLQSYKTQLNTRPIQVGIIADLHGDFDSFQKALTIFDNHHIKTIICAGDIVDRGSDADKIIKVIKARNILCIAGNHDRTVVVNQARWRKHENQKRMRELGRIVNDETIQFLENLPQNEELTINDIHIIIGHGTPFSDVLGVFPDSRQSTFDRLHREYADIYDLMILGHTHHPMHVTIGNLHIVNSGSLYGVTIRDSNTCAILSLPDYEMTLFDIGTGQQKNLDIIYR